MKEYFKLIEETKDTLVFESSNTYKGIAKVIEKDNTPLIVTGIDTSILTFKKNLLKNPLHINQYFVSDKIIAIYSYAALKHHETFSIETVTFIKTITRDGIIRYYAII